MAEMYEVTNLGDSELRCAFNSRLTVIGPNETKLLDRECAVIHFGDWTRRGDARRDEYRRLRGQAGCLPGALIYDDDGNPVNPDVLWAQIQPKVVIKEYAGDEVVTVLEDPDGDRLSMQGAPEQDKERMLQQMRAQLDRLESELSSERAAKDAVHVEEDSPQTATQRRRREPQVVQADG